MPYSRDDSKYLKRVGKAIRELRGRSGMSQEDLAAKTGLHRTYIGSLERGERNVSILNIRVLASALGVSPGELANASEVLKRSGSRA